MKAVKKNFKVALSLMLSVAVFMTTCVGLNLNATVSSVENNSDSIYFVDDFNRATITGGSSGWIEQRTETNNKISDDGVLQLKDTSGDGFRGYAHDLIMRPMSEATINQKASVEINKLSSLPAESNASANVHLRLISNDLASVNSGNSTWYDQSYYARVSSTKLQIHRTYARTATKDMGTEVLKDSSGNNAVAEYSAVDSTHTYTLVFTAEGTYPTTLTAILYDLTDNEVVAKVEAVDNTVDLQVPGTAALSMCGGINLDKTAYLDNYEYKQIGSELYYYDDFELTDITKDDASNGWIEQVEAVGGTSSNFMGNTGSETNFAGMLRIADASGNGNTANLVVRPMSEAAINQKASVTVANPHHVGYEGSSANLHVRVTSADTETATSYYASLSRLSFSIYSSLSSTPLVQSTYARDIANTPYRLELEATGTYPTTLTARFYEISDGSLIDEISVSDSSIELQCPGTTGLSVTKSSSATTRTGAFDSFMYKYDPNLSFHDGFDRDTIIGNNSGWVEQKTVSGGTSENLIGDGTTDFFSDNNIVPYGVLVLTGPNANVGHKNNLIMRPMSEASLNQTVSVLVKNIGHFSKSETSASANVHVRVTSTSNKYATSYFASVNQGYLKIRKAVSADGTTESIVSDLSSGEVVNSSLSLGTDVYRLELKAEGSYPTKLTAILYNVTKNEVAATLIGTDNEVVLQYPGTVGLSVTNNSATNVRKGRLDDFMYEYTALEKGDINRDGSCDTYDISALRKHFLGTETFDITTSDNFTRTTITGNNSGWIEQIKGAQGSFIGDGVTDFLNNNKIVPAGILVLTETGKQTGHYENLIARRMSEAAVNQKASATITNLASHFIKTHTKASANVHVRVTGVSNKYASSYVASAQDSFLTIRSVVSADGNTTPTITSLASKTDLDLSTAYSYKLELEAQGSNPTTLTATLTAVDTNEVVATLTATDSTEALQNAGTVGLSVTNNDSNARRYGYFNDFSYEYADTFLYSDINSDGNTNICDLVAADKVVKSHTKESYIIEGGGSDEAAAVMRDSIVGAEDVSVEVTGTTYYISPDGDDSNDGKSDKTPWKTLAKLYKDSTNSSSADIEIQTGDAILFERGGVYRTELNTKTGKFNNVDVTGVIAATSGVYYGAYGEGAKPVICSSAQDYADSSIWSASADNENIWELEFSQEADAGIIVFNNGEWAGRLRANLESLAKNGDFYHNVDETKFYLYCDTGNPGEVYNNIEIGVDQPLFQVYSGRTDITIDNLCFKYTGGHGISAYDNVSDITIKNCEFGWIGGSIQDSTTSTRYGNAIQFWDSCSNVDVQNNWIYQVYDAGFTFQFSDHGDGESGGHYENITFSDNLVEYCTYSVELFSESSDPYVKDVTISDNIMRFAGYGWGNQRPSKEDDSHINAWSGDTDYDASIISNFNITNNIFDCSTTQIINWKSSTALSGVNVSGNIFYEKSYGDNRTMNYGTVDKVYAKNQSELEVAIAIFDSAPNFVKWLEP